ncbi:Retrovirus-related Pol polyprotein from transposon [Apostichopus japonicus]|uniref:Retrovirus-related Pol polyprotein from transposon n=1 Tax=Stichopus japonicus TaxID=307972 RepID=A0A2G8L2K6_STIJA|nr:Retrovirus-related Pol polyprotein from transposon [Apostichopus japonicus]
MADDRSIPLFGCGNFSLKMGDFSASHPVWVADISTDFILGCDFLAKYKCQIDLGLGQIKIGNIMVQCFGNERLNAPSNVVNRITVAETVCISPGQEIVVPGLYNSLGRSLDENQKALVRRLLLKHESIFAKCKEDLGRTDIVKHKIPTKEVAPIKQHARRLPLNKREDAANEVSDMLKRGVIEPSSSPWASPVVLVKKKDGSTRFCVDYRRLNDITTKDSYPIPRIDDSLDSLNGSTWFTTLDLASGYWQVEMDESDREKTAFITHSGLYQFCVMPFGLCNAPATFERLMEKILSGLQWQTCLVYLDDVIIFGKNFEEHIAAIDDVFTS